MRLGSDAGKPCMQNTHCNAYLLTVSVNSFTVLDYDVPAPPIPTVAEFTFNYPPPCRSEPQDVRHFGKWPLPLSSTPPHLSALNLTSKQDESWENGQCHAIIIDSNIDASLRPLAWSPCLPSVPNSLPILPRVLMPVDSGYKTSSVPNLDDVKIPSPLLYHRKSQDKSQDILVSPKDTVRDELFRAARMTGQSSRADIVNHNGMVISTAIRNVPQPPGILPSTKVTPISTPVQEMKFMTETPLSALSPKDNDTSLIFPVLEPVVASQADLQSQITASLRCPYSAFIEDDPQKMERMWDAFEAVVGRQRNPDRLSSWSFSPGPDAEPDLFDESPTLGTATTATIEIEVCSTPACTALVPARLYHHPYSGWPQFHAQEYQEPLFSFLGAIPQSMPTPTVLRKWCEDAGFEDKHVEACQNDARQVALLAREPSNVIANDVQKQALCDQVEPQCPISSASSSYEHNSVYESASEILLEDAMWSEEEWADLDWDEDQAWMLDDDAELRQSGEKTAWDEVHQRLA